MLLCTNYLVIKQWEDGKTKQKNSEKMLMKLTRKFTVNNSIIRLFCIKPIQLVINKKKNKRKPTAILYFKYLFIKCAQFRPPFNSPRITIINIMLAITIIKDKE